MYMSSKDLYNAEIVASYGAKQVAGIQTSETANPASGTTKSLWVQTLVPW